VLGRVPCRPVQVGWFWLLEASTREPHPVVKRTTLQVRPAKRSDIPAMLQRNPGASRTDIESRFSAEDYCVVAEYNGKLLG
jgi:hypothetical protein